MDAPLPNPPPPADWIDHFARSIDEQQQRVAHFVDSQRQRIAQIEAELSDEIRRHEEALEQREAQLTQRRARTEHQRRRIGRALRARRDALHREAQLRQAELEAQQQAPAAGPYNDPAADDLERRLSMAMDDLRELRSRNAELEKRLADVQSVPAQTAPSATGNLSWEVQKRQMLAALDQETDNAAPEAAAERVKIDEVIRSADLALREKEREIDDMRHLLQDQSANIGGVAVGDSALGEMLNGDALICEERANVQRMKQEWEEKLRQAEIEMSLERARIARERAELDEKLRRYQAEQPGPSPGATDRPSRAAPGRWRARLGLGDPAAE